MTKDEEELDAWVLETLRRREGMVTDFSDFFTMAGIDSKWGADTPRAIASSQTCHKNLEASLARLVEANLVLVQQVRVEQVLRGKNYRLTDPLEQFTRQVHKDA